MASGPWGLVTLALGLTPTLTAELELELELLEDELELLLLDEFALDLPLPDLPPPLDAELDEADRLKLTPVPGRCMAMVASMGAKPRIIVISQRERFIRSLRAIGLRTTPPARRAKPTERKNPRLPASHTHW